MTRLFKRSCQVYVGDTKIEGLRVSFNVTKTLKRDPNTVDVVVYNLAEKTRKRLQTQGAELRLVAGYVGEEELIFVGGTTVVTHGRNGPDWESRFQAGDGGESVRRARINESFAKGTTADVVLRAIAGQMGVGLGNVIDEVRKGSFRQAFSGFSHGFAAAGWAVDTMDTLTRTMGFDWSVQDQALQLIRPDGVVGTDVVRLSAFTGLIGSPEAGEKGIVKARSLIQQKLLPGRKCELVSESFNGFFRVEKVVFVGDTHGTPWYAETELKPVRTVAS